MVGGYVKFPRYLFTNRDWLDKEEYTPFEAQAYLLQAAAFAPTVAKVTAHISITLQRGQLLTSVRRLAKAWGWPLARVQRFLETLKNGEHGRLRISVTALDRGMDSVITITDYDAIAVEANDTPCDTISDTLFDTRNMGQSGVQSLFATLRDTQSDTPCDTAIDTHREEYKEIKPNTHTGIERKEGGAGGDSAADELYAFVCVHYPELQKMRFPLSKTQCGWILRRCSMAIAKRLFGEMANKQVYKRNSSVYSTFTTFAKYDEELKEAQKTQKVYTYNEMCDYVYANGIKSDAFVQLGQDRWVLRSQQRYASN